MKDPLNNFEIPESWLELALKHSDISREELERKIKSGVLVILSDGTSLKRGYTTGTTMAAASKAAVLSLNPDIEISNISVPTPAGLRAEMPVRYAKSGFADVLKVENDHESDITRGASFCAKASFISKESDDVSDNVFEGLFEIVGGVGIGVVQRDGFEVPVGEYAINPMPTKQINESVLEAIDELKEVFGHDFLDDKYIRVELSVPDGLDLSRKTLNERIGIVGGISILGTTGFVEPWNDHLGEMKDDIISTSKHVVLTTGRRGMAHSTMLFPGYDVVLVGSRITEGIKSATAAEEIIVCGLPGLVLKWGDPEMMKGSGYATVVEMIELDPENPRLYKAFEMAIQRGNGARIVVINRDGQILKDSNEYTYSNGYSI
ncbi:MAG: cobalt-precorrin-5B (C(1))-methyltransferase [Methanosarcinaceae archaeon]|nr:cobalt-precorrin-5B (C(1))-methyltransferase [Methanosarcinaceae archaeon]